MEENSDLRNDKLYSVLRDSARRLCVIFSNCTVIETHCALAIFDEKTASAIFAEAERLEVLNVKCLNEIAWLLGKAPTIWSDLWSEMAETQSGFQVQWRRLVDSASHCLNETSRREAGDWSDSEDDKLNWLIKTLRVSARQIGSQSVLDKALNCELEGVSEEEFSRLLDFIPALGRGQSLPKTLKHFFSTEAAVAKWLFQIAEAYESAVGVVTSKA